MGSALPGNWEGEACLFAKWAASPEAGGSPSLLGRRWRHCRAPLGAPPSLGWPCSEDGTWGRASCPQVGGSRRPCSFKGQWIHAPPAGLLAPPFADAEMEAQARAVGNSSQGPSLPELPPEQIWFSVCGTESQRCFS